MPWTEQRYPVAMRHLPPDVRDKAVAMANAMLADGMDEGRAIRIAIAQARRWAVRHRWDAATPAIGGGGWWSSARPIRRLP